MSEFAIGDDLTLVMVWDTALASLVVAGVCSGTTTSTPLDDPTSGNTVTTLVVGSSFFGSSFFCFPLASATPPPLNALFLCIPHRPSYLLLFSQGFPFNNFALQM
eukprot:Lithocolla_globosa_v1_NODE_1_length_16663_cov_42.954359.p15 type:complete len:105 gc:universal NODE_1_length_16663_cov_42.954359:12149-11835(-)